MNYDEKESEEENNWIHWNCFTRENSHWVACRKEEKVGKNNLFYKPISSNINFRKILKIGILIIFPGKES